MSSTTLIENLELFLNNAYVKILLATIQSVFFFDMIIIFFSFSEILSIFSLTNNFDGYEHTRKVEVKEEQTVIDLTKTMTASQKKDRIKELLEKRNKS